MNELTACTIAIRVELSEKVEFEHMVHFWQFDPPRELF